MNIMQDRFGRGLEKIREIHGDAGVPIIDTLKSSSPDLARYIVEFAFWECLQRGPTDGPGTPTRDHRWLDRLRLCSSSIEGAYSRSVECGLLTRTSYPNGCSDGAVWRLSGSPQRRDHGEGGL